MKTWLPLLLVPFLFACSGGSDPEPLDNAQTSSYVLTTNFTGSERPLGVALDENGVARPVLVDSTGSGDQRWVFIKQADDLYQISLGSASGSLLLAVNSVGDLVSVDLASSPSEGSDVWQVTPLPNGFCRITSELLGSGSSLDIVNDDDDRELKMATSGDFSGQSWQLEATAGTANDALLSQCLGDATANAQTTQGQQEAFIPTASYRQQSSRGFSLLISPQLDSQQGLLADALIEIDAQLALLESALSVEVFTELQAVPIWVEVEQQDYSAGQFHLSAVWLANNGYNPEKAGAVEISNLALFTDRSQSLIASPLIHELSHARQFYLNADTVGFETTYQSAINSNRYDSVLNVNGTMQTAYATSNAQEYFAELSEAYFATNDFYPFNRSELLDFDPEGYQLITRAWGIDGE